MKLLNTVYIIDGVEKVTRWIKTAADYVTVSARLVIKMYQKHMGHVDRVDKNVSLSGIHLLRCQKRYHRQLFLWLIAAVAFNNVLILFMIIFPTAAELQKKYDGNGFGWKHYFQQELASVLMKRGRELCDIDRRTNAATVLQLKLWPLCRTSVNSTTSATTTVIPATSTTSATTPATSMTSAETSLASVVGPPVRRRVGRKKKIKRGSGGGRNKRKGSPPITPTTAIVLKQRRLSRQRLENYEFQAPPKFVPQKVGCKKQPSSKYCVVVGNSKHSLVHASTLGIWKLAQGRCVSCYALAPPEKGGKTFMQDGSRITSTNFACDVCEVHLCNNCHHNVYPPHVRNGTKPRSIIYTNNNDSTVM